MESAAPAQPRRFAGICALSKCYTGSPVGGFVLSQLYLSKSEKENQFLLTGNFFANCITVVGAGGRVPSAVLFSPHTHKEICIESAIWRKTPRSEDCSYPQTKPKLLALMTTYPVFSASEHKPCTGMARPGGGLRLSSTPSEPRDKGKFTPLGFLGFAPAKYQAQSTA